MKGTFKITFLSMIVCCLMGLEVYGQISTAYGISSVDGINLDYPRRYGVHFAYERPRSEVNTFYLRLKTTFPIRQAGEGQVEFIDFNNPIPGMPSTMQVDVQNRSSYWSLDGGTRIYFYNTYDAGFALYGGLTMKGIYSKFRQRFGEFDETIYQPSNQFPEEIGIFYGIGGNIGFKHQLISGTGNIMCDFGVDLVQSLTQNNIIGNEIAVLGFVINLAYRFDHF
jgi:hypothetical protein